MKNIVLSYIFLFVFLLIIAPLSAYAERVIALKKDETTDKFGKKLEYFYDPSSQMSLEEVLAAQRKEAWKDVEKEKPNWGFRDGKLWLKFKVETPTDDDSDWVFDVGFHFFMTADLFNRLPDGSWKKTSAGKELPFAERELQYQNPAFLIRPAPVVQEFVLALKTPAVMKLPGRFVPLRKFAADPSAVVFALYLGIVLSLALFHFVLGFLAREKVYFFYSLYAAFSLLTIADVEGYSYRYLWHDVHWWFIRSATVMACLSGLFGMLFVLYFVQPSRLSKMAVTTVSLIQFAFMIVVMIHINSTILMVSHFVLGIAVAIVIAVAMTESIKRNVPARTFLFAFCLMGAGVVVFTLQNLGLISSTLLSQHGIGIGQATEILLLSVALSRRMSEFKFQSLEREFSNFRLQDRVEMARWFAHEARRPYQSILLGIDNVLRNVSEPEMIRSLSGLRSQARNSLARLNSLAKNLVFGMNETKRSDVITLFGIMRDAFEEVNESFQNATIRCILYAQEDFIVEVDSVQIKRVFVNLLANAVEASSGGGTVTVRAVRDESSTDYVLCQVMNVGVGLSESMVENLFNGENRSSKKGGMGLGLMMVKKILEFHGSTIQVRSEPVEPGGPKVATNGLYETTISWSLKIYSIGGSSIALMENLTFAEQELPVLGESDEHAEIQSDSLKVCLVDDDREYLAELKTLCSETIPGSLVVCLAGPDEAIKSISENTFDLIISDVEFGLERDGFWLLREIVGRECQTPVILHTGSVNPDYESHAMSEGAFEYVSKPMTSLRLREIIGRLKVQGEEKIICCVDDEPDIVMNYLDGIADAKVMYFTSPDEILDAAQRDGKFWINVELVLSDYYFAFANASEMKFVRSLKRSGFKGPVILFSNIAGGDVGEEFDGRIDKMKIPSLKWLLEKTARPVRS